MVASCCDARNLLLLTGERGITGDGCQIIAARSQTVAMLGSIDNANGINNYSWYHVKVLEMRLADVAHDHTQ